MAIYVMRNGNIVEKYGPLDIEIYEHGSAPAVISDTMNALRHHGTGRVTESKSQFRRMTKASGCIETGNSLPEKRYPIKLDRRQRRDDIRRSIYELRNGKC